MKSRCMVWAVVTIAGGFLTVSPCLADGRPAEEILKDFRSVVLPDYDSDRAEDEAYVQRFMESYVAAKLKQAALILELYETHPDHEQVTELMAQRWSMIGDQDEYKDVVATEIEQVLETAPDSPLACEGRFYIAQTTVQFSLWGTDESDVEAAERAAEVFIKAHPDDERGARLLGWVVRGYESGSEQQLAMFRRIKEQYPNSLNAKYVDGQIRAATGIGKPFELAFTDAITGTEVSMEQLRGQVVVIDFWATWCGPCVAEMPHMKELYAKFHDDGVEFIGVSLDRPEERGGLEALKNYVAEKEIPWPQYYQGAGWESEFSVSWGVNSIPALFIVDKAGNLHSTQARGELEKLIPELLAK